MAKKIILGIGIILFIVFLFFFFFSWTPRIKGENAIAEQVKFEVNGTTQHILIRGTDINNPILLFVHGGPGSSDMPLVRHFNAELEEHFVVVTWDQRGAGKSRSWFRNPDNMTVDQFVEDGIVVTQAVLERTGQEQLILVGHSWGTMLGTEMATRYPQYFSAYVGIGNIAHTAEGERLTYQFVWEEANTRGDEKAIEALAAINEPPYLTIEGNEEWLDDMLAERSYVNTYVPELFEHETPSYPWIYITTPEYSLLDTIQFLTGGIPTSRELFPQIMNSNYLENPPVFEMPVFLAQGVYDFNTPTVLAEEFFDLIEAPSKEYHLFENSGHNPQFEESEVFNQWLVDLLSNN